MATIEQKIQVWRFFLVVPFCFDNHFIDLVLLQFKEISQAFEILSDEKKRQIYDQGGMDALKEGTSAQATADLSSLSS